MYSVSSLGRPLNPRFSSNLLAILGSAAAAICVGLYNAVAAVPLQTSATVAAVGVFLAWAIGRELDPDRPAVAALAMAISFASLLAGPAELLVGAAVLASARVIAGTVGSTLRGLDLLALISLAALIGAGGITAIAIPGLLLAGAIGVGSRTRALLIGGGILAAALVAAGTFRPDLAREAGSGVDVVAVALVLGAALVRIPEGSIASRADLGGPLLAPRIEAARWVAAGTLALGFLIGGATGVGASFATAGAAVMAAGVVGFARRFLATLPTPTREASGA